MPLIRYAHNPVIKPQSIVPSRPDFEVVGTFNAGAVQFDGQVVLTVRVAERPVSADTDVVLYPVMDMDGAISVARVRRDDPRYDLSDSRLIVDRQTGETSLTSMSHLRLARSHDGYAFSVDSRPWLSAQPPYEAFGIEDGRITRLDGRFYVNYSAVSALGIATALVSTPDFRQVRREGIIFPPSNRDVVLFPERINGLYVCYHRPMPSPFGGLNIWAATSPDLIHWGNHQLILQAQPDGWESGRVGGGAPPIRTEAGWLSIYHAANRAQQYCLGAFLTPLDAPTQVIARSRQPILAPQALYETSGFFQDVVFSCGALLQGEKLIVYYGAADETIAVAEAPLQEILTALAPV